MCISRFFRSVTTALKGRCARAAPTLRCSTAAHASRPARTAPPRCRQLGRSASRRSTGSSSKTSTTFFPDQDHTFIAARAPLRHCRQHIVHELDQPLRRAVGGCQSSETKTKMVSCTSSSSKSKLHQVHEPRRSPRRAVGGCRSSSGCQFIPAAQAPVPTVMVVDLTALIIINLCRRESEPGQYKIRRDSDGVVHHLDKTARVPSRLFSFLSSSRFAVIGAGLV